MIYHDFDLWIDERNGDHYPLRAESHANAKGKLYLDPASPEWADDLHKLDEEKTNRQFSKTFGGRLYHSLFQGDIGNLYHESRGQVIGNDQAGLRIRLRIVPPELSVIPWELLFDGDRFLATSTKTPLTRFIELRAPIKELKTTLPIKVLLVIPEGSGLDTAAETHSVMTALKDLGEDVQYHVLDKKVTRQAIRDALKENPYHIFHFIGHGSYNENHHGCLALNAEDKEGAKKTSLRPIKAESFGLFFQDYPTTKLVILNSCEGAQVSATKPLAGMAPQIVNAGVPAVIAMQYPIPDKVAKLFACEFYKALCQDVDQGRVDAAIAYARRSLCQEFDETNDFALPVLFMRSPGGVIFDLQEHNNRIATAREAHTAQEVVKAREHNIETLREQRLQSAPEAAAQLDQQIQEETQNAQLAQGKIQQWRKRVVITSILVAFFVVAAAWTGFFAIGGLDDYLERKFVTSIMDTRMDKPFSDDVRLIMIREGENGALGKFDPADLSSFVPRWRANYAKLIRDLTDAKAKVVVLDIYFLQAQRATDDETKANQCLADAINYARGKGMKVIIGVRANPDGEVKDKMPEAIEQALNGSWGDVANLYRRNVTGLTREALLGRKLTGEAAAGCVGAESRVLPSLPLLAIMQAGGPTQTVEYCSPEEQNSIGKWNQPITACMDEEQEQLNLRDADGQIVKQISFYSDYQSASEPVPMFIKVDLARVSQLEDERITQPVQALYFSSENAQTWPDPCAAVTENANAKLLPDVWKLRNPGAYQEKIVLIGVQSIGECGQSGKDIVCVSDSEGDGRNGKRFGVEVQANILSNLLMCVYIRPVSIWWNLLIVLLMVALGVLLQTRFRNWLRWRPPFKRSRLDKPPEIPFLIIIVAVLYLLIAFIAYKQWRVLFAYLHYHLAALFITYWIIGLTRKRLGLH